MKETIYTIPVMDAFREPCECAFCAMHRTLELNALDFMLGASASYMEGDIRMKTDELGYCRRHYGQMYEMSNRLGLALVTQTHLARVRKDLSALLKGMGKARPKKALFAGKSAAASPLSAYVEKLTKTCYVCDMVESTFAKYVDTFFMLWPKEEELRGLVRAGNGFCLPHFAMMVDAAADKLGGAAYESFAEVAFDVQTKNLERVQGDLDWFVQKFDYRFREEPWGNAKDAVRRGIQKLSAEVIQEDSQK